MSDKQSFLLIITPYMVKANVTLTKLASIINTTSSSMSHRLKNPRNFRAWELKAIADYLGLSLEDRGRLIDV